MEFVKVSGVKIPEGDVVRITETSSGRVLWERGLKLKNAGWVICNSRILTTVAPPLPVMQMSRRLSSAGKYFPTISVVHDDISSSGEDIWYGTAAAPRIEPKEVDSYSVKLGGAFSFNYPIEIFAVSDAIDEANNAGLSFVKYNGDYRLGNFSSFYNLAGDIGIDARPRTDGSVYITYSAERGEFLVTGLNKGSCVVPKNLSSVTSFTYNANNLARSCWASGLEKYFAATGSDANVSSSPDGYNWTTSKVFNSGRVLGVEYLSGQNRLCAVSDNTNKIALSTDGETWTEKNTPFTGALAYEYDAEDDIFAVVNTTGAYLTRDFVRWESVPLPLGVGVNFRDLLYAGHGIFIGYERGRRQLFFLTTQKKLEVSASVLNSLESYDTKLVPNFPY